MEPSQTFGGTEECHSSESGWTMYIGSPIDGDDDGEHSDEGDNDKDDDDDSHADDSDDSMVSDASSGPRHPEHKWGDGEGSRGKAHCRHEEDVDDDKYCFDRIATKPIEQQRAERMKNEKKQETMFMAKRANSAVQSGSKVRKNIQKSKRI